MFFINHFCYGQEKDTMIYILQNPINKYYYYIDAEGKVLFRSVNNFTFSEGLAAVSNIAEPEGKAGYIDKRGKMIIEPGASFVTGFSEGLAAFCDKSGLWGYISRDGKIKISPVYQSAEPFSEGLARVKLNNKYGFIDKNGKTICEFKYDFAGEFKDGIACVSLKKANCPGSVNCYGYIDFRGKQISELAYNEASDFGNGIAWVGNKDENKNLKYALINKSGKILTGFKYYSRNMPPDSPEITDGKIWTEVQNDDYTYDKVLLDINGKEIKTVKGLRNLIFYPGSYNVAQREDNGRYYYVDKLCNDIFGKTFYYASGFSDGLAIVIGDPEGFASVIDTTGKIVLNTDCRIIGQFSEGVAPAEKGGKWGYINKKGEMVVGFRFESAESYTEGCALVYLGGKAGYINSSGDFIVKPEFQVGENYNDGIAKVGTLPQDATMSGWEYWEYIDKKGSLFWVPENKLYERSQIILPTGYNPSVKYPLVIALPYTDGSGRGLISRYYGSEILDEKRSQQKYEQIMNKFYPEPEVRSERDVIIMITPGIGSAGDHSVTGFAKAIERYNECILSDIERNKTLYSIDTNRIILVGFSLGGDLSWALLNKNAGKFKGAIITASSCSYTLANKIDKLKIKDPRIFFSIGEMESTARIAGIKNAKKQLDKAGISNEYYIIPGEGHSNIDQEKYFDALEFVLFK